MLFSAAARVLGLVLGAEVTFVAKTSGPLAPLTAHYESLSITATDGTRLFPFQSASLESAAPVQLGWKVPALLAAPLWALATPSLLLPLLLLYISLPAGPRYGALAYEAFVSDADLNRGAWPNVLGSALTLITRGSLPGMVASLSAELDGSPGSRLPASSCTSARVEGDKLVLDGTVEVAPRRTLAYTLRSGLAPGAPGTPGVPAARSALLWTNPEIMIQPFGEQGMLAKLVPKVWVPVLSAGGVVLPPGWGLRRVAVSDAAGGIVVDGRIEQAEAEGGAAEGGGGVGFGGRRRGEGGGGGALLPSA